MFININNIILGSIIIYLFIIIQHKSNTLLSFIPNYNNNNNSNIQNNKNENEIEKLKEDIIKLNNENSSLKDENQRLKIEIQKLKSELKTNNQNLEAYRLKINELNLLLTNKDNEINNLNNEMKNLQLNNNRNEYININEILNIKFKSIDQKVDMPIICQKDDKFVIIEEKLYDKYPELKDFNTYFTVNGRTIKRFKSMSENDIRNNDKILLNIYE